jgi:hypothetical protein
LDAKINLQESAEDALRQRRLGVSCRSTRARYPGSKYDPCLVLEGVQGVAKTGIGETIAAGPVKGISAIPQGCLR